MVVGKRRGNHRADIVGHAGTSERRRIGDQQMTAMTPLQHQTNMRLLEARRLMMSERDAMERKELPMVTAA